MSRIFHSISFKDLLRENGFDPSEVKERFKVETFSELINKLELSWMDLQCGTIIWKLKKKLAEMEESEDTIMKARKEKAYE